MRVIAVLIAAFALFAGIEAAAQTLLVFTRGNAYSISLKDSMEHFLIPVETGNNIKAGNLSVKIKDAKSDKQTDQVYIGCFNNLYLKDTLHDTKLNIDIDNRTPLQPATYTLTILVNDTTNSKKAPEKYTITIGVNAAQIAALPTAVVEMKDKIFWSAYTTCDTMIPIRETGKKMWLTKITLNNLYVTDPANHKIGPAITGESNAPIPAGGSGKIIFKTNGDLPLGKSIATVDLVSPQLADPISMNFEITTRRGGYFLFTIIILGLFVGFISRTYLIGIINSNTARLPAYGLLRIIEEEVAKKNDPVFRAAAQVVKNDLSTGLLAGTSDQITAAITAAKTTLDKAVGEFVIRLTVVKASLDKLKNTVGAIPFLPAPFKTTIGDAASSIASAQSSIDAGTIEDAAITINTANNKLESHFYDALSNYANNMHTNLEKVQDSKFLLPEVAETIKTLVTTTGVNFRLLPIEKMLFTTIQGIDFDSRALLREIARNVNKKVTDTANILLEDGVVLPTPQAVQDLKERKEIVLSSINNGVDTPEVVLITLPAQLNDMGAAMVKATNGQLNALFEKDDQKEANKPLFEEIRTAVEKGQYEEAARKLVVVVKSNTQEKKRGAGPGEGFVGPTNFMSELDDKPDPKRNNFDPEVSKVVNEQQLLDAAYKKTSNNILRAKIFQNLISGILITFVGYFIYSNTFIGTPMETISVFFWAFFLDVSMNTITSSFVAKLVK